MSQTETQEFQLTAPEPQEPQRTDEQALAEIWGIIAPDCGPDDNNGIVSHVANMQRVLDVTRAALKELTDNA